MKKFLLVLAASAVMFTAACDKKEPAAYSSTEVVELNSDGSVDYNSQTVVVPNE